MPYRDVILLALLVTGSVAVGFAFGYRLCVMRMGGLVAALRQQIRCLDLFKAVPSPAQACAADMLDGGLEGDAAMLGQREHYRTSLH